MKINKYAGLGSILVLLSLATIFISEYFLPYRRDIRSQASVSSMVLLVIDDKFNNAVATELTTYEQDIARDLGVNVIRNVVNVSTVSPIQIRNNIRSLYQASALKGAVLIGDIPAALIGDSRTPSDMYYEDFDDLHWKDTNGDGVFDYWWDENGDGVNDWLLNAQSSEKFREIWTGRIQPPSASLSLTDRINMLKSYFNRNHLYRTGQKKYAKTLIYAESVKYNGDLSDGEDTYQDISARANGFFDSSWIFNRSAGDTLHLVWTDTPTQMKNAWMTAITQPNEYAFINVHGTNTIQWFGANQIITSADYKSTPPNSAFIDLASCSNGNFMDPDYLAGWMLFSGDALVIRANTTVTFYIGDPQAGARERLLAEGLTFGEIRTFNDIYQVAEILGDPTLTLRNKITNTNAFTASFTSRFPTGTTTSQIPVDTPTSIGQLTIRNTSQTPMQIEYDKMTLTSTNGLNPASNTPQAHIYLPQKEMKFPLNLTPLSSVTYDIVFSRNIAVTNGIFRAALVLYTKNASTPYTITPFELSLSDQILTVTTTPTFIRSPTPIPRSTGTQTLNCRSNPARLTCFEAWRSSFTSGIFSNDADMNNSNTVTIADFEVWRRAYTGM